MTRSPESQLPEFPSQAEFLIERWDHNAQSPHWRRWSAASTEAGAIAIATSNHPWAVRVLQYRNLDTDGNPVRTIYLQIGDPHG